MSSGSPHLDVQSFIALGSNLGNSREILHRAIQKLQSLSRSPIIQSSLWQSEPVDCPHGSPPFLNAVVAIHPLSSGTPESLLLELQTLEKEFGRTPKKILNEPRPIDLDLIAFGSETRNSSTLILPHPRAVQRRFVLEPLAEIAPSLILPGQRQTVLQLASHLRSDPSQSLKILKPEP